MNFDGHQAETAAMAAALQGANGPQPFESNLSTDQRRFPFFAMVRSAATIRTSSREGL